MIFIEAHIQRLSGQKQRKRDGDKLELINYQLCVLIGNVNAQRVHCTSNDNNWQRE